jgi:hypothetical protein
MCCPKGCCPTGFFCCAGSGRCSATLDQCP